MVWFEIVIPILVIMSFPFFLWVLPRTPFKVTQPGLRFKLSVLIVLLLWLGLKLMFVQNINWLYWLAGMFFILSFVIFGFILWSVLCWGYTLSMLLSLSDVDHPIDVEQWQTFHAGPNGVRQLTIDRAQVLVRLYLATLKDDQLALSKLSVPVVAMVRFCTKLFGVKL